MPMIITPPVSDIPASLNPSVLPPEAFLLPAKLSYVSASGDASSLHMELDSSETPISLLEEGPEGVDIDELDIYTLEQACKKQDFDTISEKQIENLAVALTKAQQHQKALGIQFGSPWDSKKLFKDSKKRGRKTDLQRTILIGEMLVDSGRYPKLTRFFQPKEDNFQ